MHLIFLHFEASIADLLMPMIPPAENESGGFSFLTPPPVESLDFLPEAGMTDAAG